MADDLPTDPHDPRWLPRRSTAVLIGIGLQLFFVVVAGSLIASHTSDTGPLVSQVLIPEDVIYPDADVAPRKGKQLPPVNLDEILQTTESRLATGQALFAQHCVSCHGPEGRGDGPAGVALQPPPRNLTSLDSWKRGPRLSDLFRTLTGGLQGTQMPGFDYLSVEERFALGYHVASLAPQRPTDTPASLDSLDADFALSAGIKEPNAVPLRTAMERLVAEAPVVPGTLDPQQQQTLTVEIPRGATLFAQVVRPDQLDRLSATLQANTSWHGDPAKLQTIAVSGAPANGFRTRVARLTAADWSSLHQYLTLRFEARP